MNRSVDIRYSVAEFNMSPLTVKLQLGLSHTETFELADLHRETKSVR